MASRKALYTKRWVKANPQKATLGDIRWHERYSASWTEGRRKKRCRVFTCNAIRHGLLSRPDHCQRCCTPCKPSAHHENYTLPLAVQWFCRKCHNLVDREREKRLGIVRAPANRKRDQHYRRVYDRALELWQAGKLSQVEIGRLLGISNSTVSKWVNGKQEPK
jgi:hypothetical protein